MRQEARLEAVSLVVNCVGGVVSPILANVYLHEVLDTWFAEEVVPRLAGRAFLTRYADDAVIVCANERDARRVMAVLPKRFGRYALTLHPEKTRLVDLRSPSHWTRKHREGESRPGTFDFLGFTHYWGRSRRGMWAVKRKTSKTRFGRAVQQIALWCRHIDGRVLLQTRPGVSCVRQVLSGVFTVAGTCRAAGRQPPGKNEAQDRAARDSGTRDSTRTGKNVVTSASHKRPKNE